MAESVLKNNVFEHNMRYFKRLQGADIGTKFAPPYAILFMGYLEDKILNSFVEKPLVWWRYIDTIFMIWQHGEEKRKRIKILDSYHPATKFTAEYSLDKVNLLYVEVIRRCRSYSMNRFYDNRCNQLECYLKDKGYNEKVVRQQNLKTMKFTRKDLLNQDSKTKWGN